MPYPRWTDETMERMKWWAARMNLAVYEGKAWECAACGAMHGLTHDNVFLEGPGMRLVVVCSRCDQWSVIKVVGLFRPRLVTEASVPPLGTHAQHVRLKRRVGPNSPEAVETYLRTRVQETEKGRAIEQADAYVRDCRGKGWADAQISEGLRKAGWGQSHVDDLLKDTIDRAAKAGDLRAVRGFLQAGVSPNAPGEGGLAPLHIAAACGHGDLAALLLASGADPNAMSDHRTALIGMTPLHLASGAGQAAVVETLIASGADVDARTISHLPRPRSADGWTPLLMAASNGNAETVGLLLSHGADPRAATSTDRDFGLTCLHGAALGGNAAVIELVLRHGASCDVVDTRGFAALHMAETSDAAEALLRAGADPNLRATDGSTPLDVAASGGKTDVVRVLLEHGADARG